MTSLGYKTFVESTFHDGWPASEFYNLTPGKTYEVFQYTRGQYTLINDSGIQRYPAIRHFVTEIMEDTGNSLPDYLFDREGDI